MIGELINQIAQTGTIVIGSLGIFVALRNQHRQLNAQMFIEFSGRFQELLRLFPTEAWIANRDPSQPLPSPSHELTDCTLYTMQFIADAYYLHKGGYLGKRMWKLWEREIKKTLRGRIFRREWTRLSAEFAHSVDFVCYINSIIRSESPPVIEAPCDLSAAGF